ncbi:MULTISPECIES: uL13 family ribosomal protein [Sphingobacterium]|jgi:hypothetical protein|uniref:UL13 family ribosomal protein n=1 Tax=Sphingobacterium litopenaei TaxID=2763500 RepID=A0ABR7YGP6_9SPHI|nr:MULTISPECIES: uL13 family ribosomal protein [Sphingobacterium]MBD1430484.1 uL13 family ribosomal protein [Sphingobacterium litopenaei]NGM73536.1 hypothetical protein [Sphingobacterium sp. SGL-16]
MKITGILTFALSLFILIGSVNAQSNEVKISKLVLDKKEKKVFAERNRDSSAVVHIDTLIMKDKSSLQFYGKKDVKLIVGYAEIGDKVFISGRAGQNNASNFDIDINFQKLGSLYVVARGQDANNGTKTDPNGDAGDINIVYNAQGITPQTENKKANNYLHTDVTPGGLRVTPSSDLRNIYDQISRSAPGLRGVPQGQIYSGSPGKEGKVTITAK